MDPTLPEQRLIALLDRIAAHAGEGGRHADSESALRELYDLTSSRLYGTALRVVTNREWAEDVLQEAYLNIWRIAGNYRAALSPPLAWMGVIVRSRALDFLRRRPVNGRTRASISMAPSRTRWPAIHPIHSMPAKPASKPGPCTSACANWKRASASW